MLATDDVTSHACSHCGLPVPTARVDPGGDEQFCCAGCQSVYEVIHGLGLGAYYQLVDERGEPAKERSGSFAELDHPDLQRDHVRERDDGLHEVELLLEGVHCAACVWIVERLPRILPGVAEARLDLARRLARVRFDPRVVTLSVVARTFDSIGYQPHLWRSSRADEIARREDRAHLVRIAVAFACAGNAMLLAWSLYAGEASAMSSTTRRLLETASLGLAAVSVFGPGRVFLVGALRSLRMRTLHMDVPVAIALLLGIAWGAVNTIRHTGEVYFESLTTVVLLLLVGRWLQQRQQRRANDAVRLLASMTPATAERYEADALREVPIEALRVGDLVSVRSGGAVPADGVLRSDAASLDESILSGESRPLDKIEGDVAAAGSINLGGRIDVEVTATGERTRMGRLLERVDRLATERPRVVRLADRVAHHFVLVVLLLAAGTLVAWWRVDPGLAVEHAVALLIVTCPCALGLATPLALQAAIGRAARAGVLIRSGDAIELLARGGRLLLDKTGTLTEGRGRVRVELAEDRDALRRTAALQRGVTHPVARAFLDAFDDGAPRTVTDERYRRGGGVRGDVDGLPAAIGSPEFVESLGPSIDPEMRDAIARCRDRAETPIVVAEGGTVRAVVGVGDPVRPDAREAIGQLAALHPEIVSGDDPRVVDAVASDVGIDRAVGGRSPEQKVDLVRDRRSHGLPVFMVGDGINDAAALAIADVGIAVHGGAEASLAAADVYLSRPGLVPLVDLFDGARRAMRVVRTNFAVSLFYNAVCAALAIGGIIHPLVAAVLMPASSLTVVLISVRSRTFADGNQPSGTSR